MVGDKIKNININQLEPDWHKIELDCFFKDIDSKDKVQKHNVRSDFFDAQKTVSIIEKASKLLRDKL